MFRALFAFKHLANRERVFWGFLTWNVPTSVIPAAGDCTTPTRCRWRRQVCIRRMSCDEPNGSLYRGPSRRIERGDSHLIH